MNCEQKLKDLREKYDLLIQTVHEMNDKIHELHDENKSLKEIIKVVHDG